MQKPITETHFISNCKLLIESCRLHVCVCVCTCKCVTVRECMPPFQQNRPRHVNKNISSLR